MTNALNKKQAWRTEEGAAIAGVTFLATSVALEYLSWHVQIPFTRDVVWSTWPELPKAIGGCLLSTFGIKTQSWLNIAALLNVYGYKTMFMWHFYMPLVLALPISTYVGYLCAKPVDQHHARGATLLAGSDAVNYAKRKVKAINKETQVSDLPTGLLIHPQLRLPLASETKSLALIGSSGTGKTQIIKNTLIDTLAQQPHAKVCLLDNKGDFTELLHENQSIILAP